MAPESPTQERRDREATTPVPPHDHPAPGTPSRRLRPGPGTITVLGLGAVAAAGWLLHTGSPAAGLSLLLGAALGWAFQRGRFCFFCIFRDLIEHKDSTGMYAVLLALAVGGIGYAVVFGMFLPDPSGGRLPAQAHIGPVSWALALGGLAFGVGMAASGACISGHLYRLGEGYTKAIPALLGALLGFGLGFATWNTLYSATVAAAPTPWLPAQLGYGGALLVLLAVLAAVAVLLLRWLPERPGRSPGRVSLASVRQALLVDRWHPLATGAVVGALGVLAYLRLEPLGVTAQLGSLSRTVLDTQGVLPERLHGLDLLAGCATVVSTAILDNGWLVLGFVAAALVGGLASGRFAPSRPPLAGSVAALLGGAAMGWGAMTALGCTVGVLLSGTQAFALSGVVFALACFAGVWLGIRLGLHRI